VSRELLVPVLVGFVLFATGCAAWETVGGRYESSDFRFSVDLPKGWHRHVPTKDSLLITRDGLLLQHIQIGRYQLDKVPLVTKRRLNGGMFPVEVAEVIIDDFRSNQLMLNFSVLSNRPILVGGYPGFRVTYSYQFKDNLRRMGIYDGALVGESYFFVKYQGIILNAICLFLNR
jgi:hypothetical protein